MPTLATGSERGLRPSGFTLIELMVVVAIVALGAGLVALSLRDGRQDALEQEGVRLAAMLEAARGESRASGQPVLWAPGPGVRPPPKLAAAQFHFSGRQADEQGTVPLGQRQWLHPEVQAELVGVRALELGPDPMLLPQRVRLRWDDRVVEVGTNGLAPFAVQTPEGRP